MTVRRNLSNGKSNVKTSKDNSSSVRLSGYITPDEKDTWIEMMDRASEIEGIRNPDNGTFFSRIIRHKLRLDQASLTEYVKTHKRRREQDPART